MTSAVFASQPTFPDLLRSWRRVHKVSQGDLSNIAGISQRHLSFLESGRSSPSRDMVMRLAEALEVPLRETNSMLQAAGFAGVYTEHQLDQGEMREARNALAVMLKHHEPYGAMVIDRNWNLIMMNDASTRLFAHFIDPVQVWAEVGGDKPNMIRATLHEKGLRPYITNWDDFACYFLKQFERELTSNPYNREARELLDEIQVYPDMPEPASINVAETRPFLTLSLKKDDLSLQFFTMVSTFGTPLDVTLQEIRIETFFPADEVTEGFVQNQLPDK